MENTIDIEKYKAIIFDVDGTLYFQRPLRLRMAVALGTYYLLHPNKIRDLKIISDFRSWREKNTLCQGDLENEQYKAVASQHGVSAEHVKTVIEKWMYQKPLLYLPKYGDAALREFIVNIRSRGIKAVAYSDYPVDDKLRVLGIQMDACFCSTDPEIQCLKPSQKGIQAVLKQIGCSPDECLFIGDRDEKDGQSARSVGMDYRILASDPGKRNLRPLSAAMAPSPSDTAIS